MSKYQSPFKLPDEHMRLVGIIAAHWECLNIGLERIVAFVTMNRIRSVTVLTKNISFGTKVDLILAYARPYQISNPNLWKEFNDAIKSLRQANNLRNEYVHATWVVEEGEELPKRWKLTLKNGKLIDEYAEVKIDELEEAAQNIYDAADSITKLMLKVGMEVLEADDQFEKRINYRIISPVIISKRLSIRRRSSAYFRLRDMAERQRSPARCAAPRRPKRV